MDVLYLLVPLSVVLVFLIGAVLWIALHTGQFDDLDAPGLRVLADDDGAGGKGALDADQPMPSRNP